MWELYEQFTKFNKSEIQHFRKLEQQRKVSKADEAPRPRHNESQCSYPKSVHNINSDGCGPPENWRKILGRHRSKQATTPPSTRDSTNTTKGVEQQIGAMTEVEAHTQSDLFTACTTITRRTIAPKIAPSTLSQKRRWIKT
jgi:hypothetical protein